MQENQDGIAVLEAEIQGLLESLLELGVCEHILITQDCFEAAR